MILSHELYAERLMLLRYVIP